MKLAYPPCRAHGIELDRCGVCARSMHESAVNEARARFAVAIGDGSEILRIEIARANLALRGHDVLRASPRFVRARMQLPKVRR